MMIASLRLILETKVKVMRQTPHPRCMPEEILITYCTLLQILLIFTRKKTFSHSGTDYLGEYVNYLPKGIVLGHANNVDPPTTNIPI